jgi:ATP-binding cassette subfamily B multidrug efflux pump
VHVQPYRRQVAAVVVLQALQAIALLYLPILNADIIDNGVVKGDTGRILRVGAVMFVVTLLQGAATAVAVRLSARTAMALGRDLRDAVFRQVQRFSGREMRRIGVASLITRTSNDVQQVQMLLLSALTMIVTAPVMAAGGIVLALADPAILVLDEATSSVDALRHRRRTRRRRWLHRALTHPQPFKKES